MKIGITERGDASLDLSWVDKIKSGKVDGAILITKNLTNQFCEEVYKLNQNSHKLIIHATTTGWGCTQVEPNVPDFKIQIYHLIELIQAGFPVENCVLRIDPIIPTKYGSSIAKNVISYALSHDDLKNIRIRVSILDEYKHVKERLRDKGFTSVYPENNFQASPQQIIQVTQMLSDFKRRFETCAESKLTDPNVYEQIGCISEKDLSIMGLSLSENITENPQNRYGCHCLSCKYELLEHRKPCNHNCLYCYWK